MPQPENDEIVVFGDHVLRGFKPLGSKFFRQVLAFYGLRLQDIGPNSMLNISNFHVFCENYLQMEPDLDLWKEFFYCNKQVECKGGPLLEFIHRSTCQVIQRGGKRPSSIAKTPLPRMKPGFSVSLWNGYN